MTTSLDYAGVVSRRAQEAVAALVGDISEHASPRLMLMFLKAVVAEMDREMERQRVLHPEDRRWSV